MAHPGLHHTRRRKANKGAQAAVTKTMSTVEEDKAKTIAAIDVEGTNNGTDNPGENKDGGDGDGNSDGGAMLANESVCILLMQEYLGCSWQLARGGIHTRFGNRVCKVYGRSKSVTAILDAIITDKQARIVRF